MADDDALLVDLSDPNVTNNDCAAYATVVLERSSLDERWGFLTYNNRFPLTVGKVDNPRISALLAKGDTIVSINGGVPETYEMAAMLMRQARERLVLVVDRRQSFVTGDASPGGATTTGGPAVQHAWQQQQAPPEHNPSTQYHHATGAPPQQQPSSTAVHSHQQQQLIVATAASTSSSPSPLSLSPLVLPPSRSNVDTVLNHLNRPPRMAVYNKFDCPFDAAAGFSESFHQVIQSFLTEQALAAGSPNNDVRFDAISAVIGTGIARLPTELIKEISARGSESMRKQEKEMIGQHERERFQTHTNLMYSTVFTVSQKQAELRSAARAERGRRNARAKDILDTYKLLCSDIDDQIVIKGTTTVPSTSGLTSSLSLPPPPPSLRSSLHSAHAPPPTLFSRSDSGSKTNDAMCVPMSSLLNNHHADVALPLPTPLLSTSYVPPPVAVLLPASECDLSMEGGGGISRKSKRRKRQRAAAMAAATNSGLVVSDEENCFDAEELPTPASLPPLEPK